MAPKSKPTSASQSKAKPSSSRPRTVRLGSEGPAASSSTPNSNSLKMTRLDPLTAFSQLSSQNGTNRKSSSPGLSSLSQSQNLNSKGKRKAKEATGVSMHPKIVTAETDDTLWVDKYEPTTEAQLAVHVRKVEDVRRWLSEAFDGGPSGKLIKYRRILALTGPAGTGKTATIRVLAKEMGFEILEWRNTIAEVPSLDFTVSDRNEPSYQSIYEDFRPRSGLSFDSDYEGLFTKFEAFLTRASTCQSIFDHPAANSNSIPSSSTQTQTSKPQQQQHRRIILLEDLPNILHPPTQTKFHDALTALVSAPPSSPPVPLVIIVSDAGMRGEMGDDGERGAGAGTEIGTGSWRGSRDKVMDVRSVLPRSLVGGPYVTEIGFNPIAPTLLRKALQNILDIHFFSNNSFNPNSSPPSKELLDIIVDSSNGDIRSAIMALQFACITDSSATQKQKGKKKGGKNGGAPASVLMEAITRREQSLVLFHLLGKVLYNKRKDDPASTSATSKDIKKEREADALLPELPPLPEHLKHHERRASRVDVNALYADSPIDTSFIADWLSYIDSSGGEKWYHTNPHQFHLLTLGTLHSLPSPVPRRGQKYYKPEFFAFLNKEKEAWEGVRTTRDWVVERSQDQETAGWRAGAYSKSEVILELGGVLKAQDISHSLPAAVRPPPIHRLFSRMEFIRSSAAFGKSSTSTFTSNAKQLDEKERGDAADLGVGQGFEEEAGRDLDVFSPDVGKDREKDKGGWLEGDDIESFDF
ncbi:Rad17 cell cycle checkpoint protein-domain-containing protein [Gymnopilus junonius]|uniref:Rad17 cell cycle checkpoint protein-domain-containing protein n=1 Tax=Gymnopilus junonius TaxID=109634 RepID=A0A9P5NXZ8_GYMJU|nr:Rad17 cell cycle checkpoint protein-domain-containing protein [Gymnopilus junonius]